MPTITPKDKTIDGDLNVSITQTNNETDVQSNVEMNILDTIIDESSNDGEETNVWSNEMSSQEEEKLKEDAKNSYTSAVKPQLGGLGDLESNEMESEETQTTFNFDSSAEEIYQEHNNVVEETLPQMEQDDIPDSIKVSQTRSNIPLGNLGGFRDMDISSSMESEERAILEDVSTSEEDNELEISPTSEESGVTVSEESDYETVPTSSESQSDSVTSKDSESKSTEKDTDSTTKIVQYIDRRTFIDGPKTDVVSRSTTVTVLTADINNDNLSYSDNSMSNDISESDNISTVTQRGSIISTRGSSYRNQGFWGFNLFTIFVLIVGLLFIYWLMSDISLVPYPTNISLTDTTESLSGNRFSLPASTESLSDL